jgi:hypothetical protein
MKTKLLTAICALAITAGSLQTSSAAEEIASTDGWKYTSDILVARPIRFGATVIGSAIFVVGLPVALMSGSVKKTADVLVVRPAKATFTRPLGTASAPSDLY